jgi:hypothetical protein
MSARQGVPGARIRGVSGDETPPCGGMSRGEGDGCIPPPEFVTKSFENSSTLWHNEADDFTAY